MLINAVKNAKNTSNKSQSCLTNNADPHNCLKGIPVLGFKTIKNQLAEGTYCTLELRVENQVLKSWLSKVKFLWWVC